MFDLLPEERTDLTRPHLINTLQLVQTCHAGVLFCWVVNLCFLEVYSVVEKFSLGCALFGGALFPLKGVLDFLNVKLAFRGVLAGDVWFGKMGWWCGGTRGVVFLLKSFLLEPRVVEGFGMGPDSSHMGVAGLRTTTPNQMMSVGTRSQIGDMLLLTNNHFCESSRRSRPLGASCRRKHKAGRQTRETLHSTR